MVVVVLGLRTSGHSLNSLTTSLERLCSKEDRTWKERLFNQTKLVKKKPESFSSQTINDIPFREHNYD